VDEVNMIIGISDSFNRHRPERLHRGRMQAAARVLG
jgi:hypothetical protein